MVGIECKLIVFKGVDEWENDRFGRRDVLADEIPKPGQLIQYGKTNYRLVAVRKPLYGGYGGKVRLTVFEAKPQGDEPIFKVYSPRKKLSKDDKEKEVKKG